MVFGRLDTNGDGVITVEEFIENCQSVSDTIFPISMMCQCYCSRAVTNKTNLNMRIGFEIDSLFLCQKAHYKQQSLNFEILNIERNFSGSNNIFVIEKLQH